MKRRVLGVIAAASGSALAFAAPAAAHHAIGATVDTGKQIVASMVLTKVDWINPHAWFHFSLTKADGTVVKDVAVEWMGIAGLRQRGYMGPEAFPVGRTYTVSYYPNRDGSVGGHLISIVGLAAGAAPPPAPLQEAMARPKYSLEN